MIWELVENTLSALGLPTLSAAANQMILASGETLPDQFLVYQLISAPPLQHADDRETMRIWRVQVSIFDRNGLSNLPDVTGVMVEAGFTRGPMRELEYDKNKRHFGLGMDFQITSDEEESDSY